MEFTVAKEKGSNRYYVCRVEEERVPLSRRFTEKKKALHHAADMEGLGFKEYMVLYKKEKAKA